MPPVALLITVLTIVAVLTAISALGTIRYDPWQVQMIHRRAGVPLKYFPVLAGCEFAGALGLIAGIWWRPLGIGTAVSLVLYFLGAIVAHLRVGDIRNIGYAVFMLALAATALIVRVRLTV